MKRITPILVALLAVLWWSAAALSPARASIMGVNVDGLGVGDDGFNITRDTATGLDWLDLTLTIADNYDAVVAGAYYTTHGFTHATEAQVQQLFTDAGLVFPDSTPISSLSLSVFAPAAPFSAAQAEALFDAVEILSILLGNTTPSSGNESGGSIGVTATVDGASTHSTAAIQGDYSPFTGNSANCWGTDSVLCDSLRFHLDIDVPFGTQPDNSGGGQIGHFLVRATPTTPTGIPEPATIAVLGFGLAGLGFMRRRRRAA